jgi:HEPN domain-containing protein
MRVKVGKRMVSEEEKSMNMIESFLRRARNKLDEAKEHLERYNYSESISASQECIELSVKAIFLLFQEKYPKKHEFTEEEFEKILQMIPAQLNYLDFPKVYLYSKFWSQFYTVAKYGLEKLGVGADKLFEKEETELALKHAKKCEFAASRLYNYKKYGG